MKIYKQKVLVDAHKEGIELAKKAISDFCGTNDFTIYYNENGKPLCDKCCFNISHKKDAVVCVVSHNNIGIDIEYITDIKERNEYMLMSREEAEFINFSPEKRNERFLTIFTMKEAFVKMKGGKLKDATKLNTVLHGKIKKEFNGFEFTTEKNENFIITVCKEKKF